MLFMLSMIFILRMVALEVLKDIYNPRNTLVDSDVDFSSIPVAKTRSMYSYIER